MNIQSNEEEIDLRCNINELKDIHEICSPSDLDATHNKYTL